MTAEATGAPSSERPTTSTRDPEQLRKQVAAWLSARVADPAAEVGAVQVPEKNGMSSETLLFDAVWSETGVRRDEQLVARVAPDVSSVPVFPTYDLEGQFNTMRAVAEHSSVPVPMTYWWEPDPSHLGAPFFVMGRVDGDVPPDVLPYDFGDSWVFDASPEDLARMQRASVEVLAQLHTIPDPTTVFAFLGPPAPGESALRRHVNRLRDYYDWVTSEPVVRSSGRSSGGMRSPLIESGFDWLDANWPAAEGPTVLSWGDSRIGNMMYRNFTPVAVFDWEMADFAPPEVDVAWMIFLHRFFEDLAIGYGLPGMPNFLRRDDVVATYAELSGYQPQDLDFYTAYAGLRHAVVMFRVQQRSIHFGEAVAPENPDEMFMHHATLRAMIEGTYWDGVA
jgi:aminoglycoside phosphotransferase (APT) family kinase protein